MSFEPLIRKLSAVETLSDVEQKAMISLCDIVQAVQRKRDVISAGDVPESIHLVLSGWAARYSILPDGSRRITAILLPGDFCDLHVTTLVAMDHGVTALTDCMIAHIDTGQLDEVTRSVPILTRALWRSTLVDEAILRQWLVSAGRRDALQGLGHLLCELYLRAQWWGLSPTVG